MQTGHRIINEDEKSQLALIMVMQLLRGKQSRAYEKKLFDELLPSTIEKAKEKFGPLTDDQQKRLDTFGTDPQFFKQISIGANWNAKYLRALQCMLIPTQGKGIQGRSFFEADFGKTAEDFVMYLAMPERLLNKRGHFVERKDEPKFEREIRYTQWSENRHLIDTWMKYYSMFEKDTVLEYIGCNRFSVETLDKIENEELKKLYFLYLTPSATIRVFSDCTEDTKRIISTFILEELPFMYSRIVETILSSKPGYKVIAGILENFGEKVCTDLLKKIDLFSGHDNDKLTMLIKANKSKRLVDFDFSLLQFIPYFHVSNLLSKQEEQIIMNSAYELKEAPIRKILLLHLDELKDVLIKTNGAQPGDTQIISVIEEQIKELYHQISIFEL